MWFGSNFIYLFIFVCGNPIVPAPFVEETPLSSLNGLGISAKNHLNIDWTLNFIPLMYVSILMPFPHSFDCCRFAISFEIRKYDSSDFVFLSPDCFGYSGPLAISYEFCKKSCWNLIGFVLHL
uniref:Uncharacterized protein n=1 Tax=Rousettus aegyptiacus TaxID=9407 RepID=A0A7J8GA30_ROUAE|nr:hypothetical protein HJG63_011599 [Rousettus aegyptiacus]